MNYSHTDIIILAALIKKPAHGYEIKKRMGRILGKGELNNNALYPSLKRLLKCGLISKEVARSNEGGKPDRNIYSITKEGSERLRVALGQFSEKQASDDPEFYVRIAFFELLDANTRNAILDSRRRALEERIAHIEQLESEGNIKSYSAKLVNMLKQKIKIEIDWISKLQESSAVAIKEVRAGHV